MKNISGYILLLLALLGGIFLYTTPKNYINSKHYKQEKRIIDSLIQVDTRRKLMAYTLVTAYEISFYEAYYYSCIIDDFSQVYNSDWTIYGATIRIESNFNATAKNPSSSASGIMQLIESTAEEQAKRLGISYNKNETVWKEVLNMTMGCHYISKHLSKGEAQAIKSYVGGPAYSDTSSYVKEYYQNILKERKRLKLIYKGVMYDYYKGQTELPDIKKMIK